MPSALAFRRSIHSLAVAIVTLTADPAAAMTVQEAKCREHLADSFGDVVRYAHRAVRNCHRRRDKGSLPASTACNDVEAADLATGGARATAEDRFRTAVAAHCKDVPAVLAEFPRCPAAGRLTDDAGPTTGIDSFDELADCLSAQVDDVVGRTAEATLGLPDLLLDKDARHCHARIADALAKIVKKVFHWRLECQVASDDAGGPLDFVCGARGPEFTELVDGFAERVESDCDLSAAIVDSCATTASGIADCAMDDHAAAAAGGLAALAWELPGTCPATIAMSFSHDIDRADTDLGWTGFHHDAVPAGEYDVAAFSLACDEDCASCGGTPGLPADHCRCTGDSSIVCSVNTDCAGPGGNCECYLSPPVHVSAASTPYCLVTPLRSPIGGTLDPASGSAALDVEIRQRIHTGLEQARPCPTCTGGVCNGGARDGLECNVDAVDASFGNTSFDCPPSVGQNVTGQGTPQSIHLGMGPASLAAGLACDAPYESASCPCSTCSLDDTIACSSDAECSDAAAGVCRTDGLHGGVTRRSSSCTDGNCLADAAADSEGHCGAADDDRFCDGLLRASGRGVIACSSNDDCAALDGACPGGVGGDCGECTVVQPRECFLDPIEADASPGVLVGVGCMAPTTKASLNTVYGLPGPWRTRQPFRLHRPMCSDGVSPFEAPGGSSCP